MVKCEICGREINQKGHIKYCKNCRKDAYKKKEKDWILKNKTRRKENWKKWYKKNKDKISEERKTPKLRERWKKQAENFRRKYPDKIKAHNKVKHIKIPEKTKCIFCSKLATEKHHPDYSKPELIIFVCKDCHTKIHGGELLCASQRS